MNSENNLKRKKIITIGAVVLSAIIALAAIYYFFLRGVVDEGDFFGLFPKTEEGGGLLPPPRPTPAPEPITEPDEIKERLLHVITKPVVSPVLSQDGTKILYYAKAGGNLESVDLEGKNEQKLSNTTILGVLEALWQPKTITKNILTYIESNTAKRFIYDIASTSVIFLPPNITTAQWSPDGKKIAYILPKKGQYHLTIADENAQKPEVVYSTPIPDFNILWPSNGTIFLASRPSGAAPGLLLAFNIKSETANEIITEGYGMTLLPSPDGKKIIYSKTGSQGSGLKLYLSDAESTLGAKSLNIVTLPEKCAYAGNGESIYCAVPRNAATFSRLPDDWYMGNGFFADRFVKLNATTSMTNILFDAKKFDAFNLFLSQDEKYLFFQDKNDFTVWRLKL